jgi:hypothetical protein
MILSYSLDVGAQQGGDVEAGGATCARRRCSTTTGSAVCAVCLCAWTAISFGGAAWLRTSGLTAQQVSIWAFLTVPVFMCVECCGSVIIIIFFYLDPIFVVSFGSGSGSYLKCKKFLFRP